MEKSQRLYIQAKEIIPWGTQTNSKRPDESMADVMPAFIEEGEGCRIKDVDGNWYIDYRSALGPIILGYRHPEVDGAVRKQMDKGVLFSMASPLEIEVARLLVDNLPGIDQVHFVKTGNNANMSAVRLARAFTGREHIATCGYHGHSDWFSCGEGAGEMWCKREGNGVPKVLDRLVTRLSYGDITAAEELFARRGKELAAVIATPYDWNENVGYDFVRRLRELTTEHGALLIFDQVLTGFRLARAGAQEFFGVIPDLSTYAKAIANGYPLAAYGGRRDVMEKLYDVTLTSTYAGETLSLAAAKATLEIILHEPIVDNIWEMGARLKKGFDEAAAARGMEARTIGLPPAVLFRFSADPKKDQEVRSLFFRELFRRGVFASRPFLLSFAHKAEHIDQTIAAMADALDAVSEVHAAAS